jgi:hypothetical protein
VESHFAAPPRARLTKEPLNAADPRLYFMSVRTDGFS